MDSLLLLSHHEPVEEDNNKVAHNAEGVEEVMARLYVDCSLRGLERVFSKVSRVPSGLDAGPEGNGCDHQGPVSERKEESIQVHVHEVGHVTHQCQSKHQVPHSLSCIYFSQLFKFLLLREILKLGEFIVLVGITFGADVIEVVRPVFVQVLEVDLRLWSAHSK